MAEGNYEMPAEALTNRDFEEGAELEREKFAQRSAGVVTVPLTSLRVWDALATMIGTAGTDDLGVTTGTYATNAPYVTTGDVKASTTTRRAVFFVALPPDFDPVNDVTIRLYCQMVTTVSDTTATVDVEAYKLDRENGALGSDDLVTTSATSINSLTLDDKDFTVNAAALFPGDVLEVRVTIAVVDGATATAVIGAIRQIELLADQLL